MATAPAPDMTLATDGFEPFEARGLTYPLGKFAPAPGQVHAIVEGLRSPAPVGGPGA